MGLGHYPSCLKLQYPFQSSPLSTRGPRHRNAAGVPHSLIRVSVCASPEGERQCADDRVYLPHGACSRSFFSGYSRVCCVSLGPRQTDNLPRVCARRLIRIYSVFLVVLGVYLVLSFVFPFASKLPADPTDAILLIFQNVLLMPGIFPVQVIITVSWQLSHVVLYSLILPPIVRLTGMAR